jgi:hypothetical protein
MIFTIIKDIFKRIGFQPILTVILILILILFTYQIFSTRQYNDVIQQIDLVKRVSFDKAAQNFLNNDYEVFTRGALYVKDRRRQDINPNNQSQANPVPSVNTIQLIETKYEDVFFFVQKGKVIRVDAKSFGINGSLFFNRNGEIISLDNVEKLFTRYPVPAEDEKEALQLFAGVRETFESNIFPLTPLIKDYTEKKFNPIENFATPNIYTGKWQHPVYTGNEVFNVVIRIDSNREIFDAMIISGTEPASQLFFDFIKSENFENYDAIPADYKEVPVIKQYRARE